MEQYHILELIGEGQFGKVSRRAAGVHIEAQHRSPRAIHSGHSLSPCAHRLAFFRFSHAPTSQVYKGRRKYGSQIVALKFIAKRGKTEKALSDLRKEIHILNSLTECEYVIRMLDWFETKAEICVVTEYAQGELYEILEDDTTLPEATIRLIAIQLVKGLQYLHSHRVIHRDVSRSEAQVCRLDKQYPDCSLPFFVFLFLPFAAQTSEHPDRRKWNAEDLRLRIREEHVGEHLASHQHVCPQSSETSVCVSRRIDSGLMLSIRCLSPDSCGTPLYMSPELVRDMPYNYAVDNWSLGVILYELFVGQPPFFTNSFYTLVHLIVDNPVNYPNTMSADFRDFLQGLLQKTPSKRLTWPHLAEHPFIRETPEEEAARAEALRRVASQQVYQSDSAAAGNNTASASAAIGRNGATPRVDGEQQQQEVKGFGGVKKPQTASTLAEQQQQAAQQQQHHQQAKTTSQTARPNASIASTASNHSSNPSASPPASKTNSSNASSASSTASHNSVIPSSRSRSGSSEEITLDLTELSTMLAPAHADTVVQTLNQFTALLTSAFSSSLLPSPLLTILPQILQENVPATLVNVLTGVKAGAYEGVTLQAVLPAFLLAVRTMVHPLLTSTSSLKTMLTPL
jgi:serine/threonine protein kinase